ncbi:helix-turn-helix domain-containing protein [Erwinia pyrifoliae]|uniref:helix-turn-helix domain-containing protein n=1 Tax=Erwinia pyrifoliae TaxID=79967 RepID=UPI00223AF0E2|nr:helix-turn-helix transcriptional regulator [Erwinia pyrifoliae]MCT2385937.1 helix-turn-helix transcriptional regulator [Erwinia pyrifoliae]MCT2385945.1 helix-turn-helix transcriptional regulator [Erwinia pyrifoliae]MCT2387912.1 helix-turn-helix transcriptional regulator [Erwinia pyrifoliae]MCT2387957.1 helix-turn-helix transcriptional regulator [Erwinia pyrifoliae]
MTDMSFLHAGIDMSAFSERLKVLRETRGLTQARLAEMIATLPRVYNRWERGHIVPQLDYLVKLADVLQVSLDELVGRTDISKDAKIRNRDLHELWQQADTLPDEEQKALILVIDSFVTRTNVEKAVLKRVKPR